MKKLLGRIIINMIAIWAASYTISGVSYSGLEGLFFAAIIFGIVNTFIKPILTLISLPLTIFTLGLFLLIVNGITVEITAGLSALNTATFGDSIKAGVIITIANWILQGIFDTKKD
ncbi:putative membrane protein [Dethiosulfatibacter aminovorans DSM 17477]|uniref:Putative membrane protein n=1 Tax=Dethiosulfatibacter aminovorans DSM 17477 TaxID=1121476 RepID=A0A1M6MBZ9_9FIRM|nr:phage holin family protein [Dethiosulfatibacter aminovorans]SHJ80890.1 putative membrane protein [Dethiosulfatibacter aminovorans DSM 17477]